MVHGVVVQIVNAFFCDVGPDIVQIGLGAGCYTMRRLAGRTTFHARLDLLPRLPGAAARESLYGLRANEIGEAFLLGSDALEKTVPAGPPAIRQTTRAMGRRCECMRPRRKKVFHISTLRSTKKSRASWPPDTARRRMSPLSS